MVSPEAKTLSEEREKRAPKERTVRIFLIARAGFCFRIQSLIFMDFPRKKLYAKIPLMEGK
jgi:hypothetical protein